MTPKGPSSIQSVNGIPPALKGRQALSMPVRRTTSGVKRASALGLFLLPCGRPGRRWAGDGVGFLLAAWALLSAFSASLRTIGSTRIGNEHRCWVFTKDNVKKASPGTGLPYRLAKNRSRPYVWWPALLVTPSSPTRRNG